MTAHEITLKVGSPHQLRDHLQKAANYLAFGTDARNTLDDAIAQIEEQVKPAIEEPREFGSIVSATLDGERALWTPNPRVGRHYWISATGFSEVWSELTDPEVLRVGLGDDPGIEEAAYEAGAASMNTKIHVRVSSLLEGSLLPERRTAYEHVLKAVEELAP